MIGWLALLVSSWAASPEPTLPIEGTAWRMSKPESAEVSGAKLHVFESVHDCNVSIMRDPADMNACLPRVDGATGQVDLAFEYVAGDVALPFALSKEQIRVDMLGKTGLVPVPEESLTLIPHQPEGFGQLWVLLIDRSSSMYKQRGQRRPVMELVVGSLLSDTVLDTFFPQEAGSYTGVMVLAFDKDVRGAWGGDWHDAPILRDRESYEKWVDALLERPRQPKFTHLYESVGEVAGQVTLEPRVREFAVRAQGEPALVVLTDGFNNERPDDVCGSNAPRLGSLLETMQRGRARSTSRQISVHTIGFGRPVSPSFELPLMVASLSERELCGSDLVERRIDGDLDRDFIDNVSLSYIAAAGDGTTYVGQDPAGLAAFLRSTGVNLYRWYELRMTLPERERARLRRPLPLQLTVRRPVETRATMTLFPHPWFDAPPPLPTTAEGRVAPLSPWRATSTLLLGLAWTMALWLIPLSLHHAWRATSRRARTVRDARS